MPQQQQLMLPQQPQLSPLQLPMPQQQQLMLPQQPQLSPLQLPMPHQQQLILPQQPQLSPLQLPMPHQQQLMLPQRPQLSPLQLPMLPQQPQLSPLQPPMPLQQRRHTPLHQSPPRLQHICQLHPPCSPMPLSPCLHTCSCPCPRPCREEACYEEEGQEKRMLQVSEHHVLCGPLGLQASFAETDELYFWSEGQSKFV